MKEKKQMYLQFSICFEQFEFKILESILLLLPEKHPCFLRTPTTDSESE